MVLSDELVDSPEHQRVLYRRGFLISDRPVADTSDYPLYGNWMETLLAGYHFYVHRDQHFHHHDVDGIVFFLIGHAYNPYSMIHDERLLLEEIARAHQSSGDGYIHLLNELTGVFTFGHVENGVLVFFTDACAMQSTYFGVVNDTVYVTSSSRLIEDLEADLMQDAYIRELTAYRFYPLLGRSLPGDLSPYRELTRATPNLRYRCERGQFTHDRYFPVEAITECTSREYSLLVASAAETLQNSMKLIHQKWDRPAISLSGGVDSQTTLACANGEYDRYRYFSYASSPAERVDADAAAEICRRLSLEHLFIEIPAADEGLPGVELLRSLMEQNYGCIGQPNSNDVRKRVALMDHQYFDVEVKSWCSEIVRAYYSKRFNEPRFPARPSPRYLSTLYKVFAHNRPLARRTDHVFGEYLAANYSEVDFQRVWWPDLIFWEFRVAAWNGLVITGEQKISNDITIPYNNRMLLSRMLAAPLERRISDQMHADIIRYANSDVADLGVSVTNVKHTRNRARLERAYLEIHSRLPF